MKSSIITKNEQDTKHPLFKNKNVFWDKTKDKKKKKNISDLIIKDEIDDLYITFIFPTVVDWYMLYQRPHQLCTAFSKMDNVRAIFISSEDFKNLPNSITQINEDLFVISKDVDFSPLVKGKTVLWFSFPPQYVYCNKYDFDLTVFDAIDNPVEEFLFWNKDIKNAVECADIISCTADILYEKHQESNKPTFLWPNGADYNHFKNATQILPKPDDFPEFNDDEIVIGFYGAMASWIDYKLIREIANKYKIVLIGKNKYYNRTLNEKNVFILEHKPYEELPYYLSHFDFTIIPFKLTEMIKGCDPIKFYEYISAGKPVISSEIEELKKKFSDITTFVNTENCLRKIEEAIKNETIMKKAKRIEIAKQNSWEVRATIALEIIKKYFN